MKTKPKREERQVDQEVVTDIDAMLAFDQSFEPTDQGEELEDDELDKSPEDSESGDDVDPEDSGDEPEEEEEEEGEEEPETPEEEPDTEEEGDGEEEELTEVAGTEEAGGSEEGLDDVELIRMELDSALAAKVGDKAEKKETPTDSSEVNFLEEFEVDPNEPLGADQLNKLLNKVYSKAREDTTAVRQSMEQNQQQQSLVQEMNQEFYGQHKDLAKYRNFVSKVSDDLLSSLSQEDKDKLPLEEFFNRVADESRKRLRIKVEEKAKKAKEKAKKEKPSFPKTKGAKTKKSSKNKKKVSEVEAEIDTMLQHVENF